MKYVVLLLIPVLVYIFYPTYDLYLKVDVFSDEYKLQEKQFLSRDRCREAAEAVTKKPDYDCYKTSVWGGMFGGYTKYNPRIRENQKELGGS